MLKGETEARSDPAYPGRWQELGTAPGSALWWGPQGGLGSRARRSGVPAELGCGAQGLAQG